MEKSDAGSPLSLKELIFMKSKSNIADRVKNFLPQIAKANAELEAADEETRQAMILEHIEQLDDESSDESESSDDNEEETSDEDTELVPKKDHVEIVFTKFEEREPDATSSNNDSDDDDFTIRRSDVNDKIPKTD